MLEARETAARERVEGLREEGACAAAALEAAEVELDRRVIAREELVEAPTVSAEATTDVEAVEGGPEAASFPAPVSDAAQGQWCRSGGRGLAVSVLSLDDQQMVTRECLTRAAAENRLGGARPPEASWSR